MKHSRLKRFKVTFMKFDKFSDGWRVYHNLYVGTWDYVCDQVAYYESMGYTAFIEAH